jgi:hypothetical protein
MTMANARLHDGWVAIPFGGDERAHIQIAVGDQNDWKPAYRDFLDGDRVVKIRPPARTGKNMVWLSVDGRVTQLGVITL